MTETLLVMTWKWIASHVSVVTRNETSDVRSMVRVPTVCNHSSPAGLIAAESPRTLLRVNYVSKARTPASFVGTTISSSISPTVSIR